MSMTNELTREKLTYDYDENSNLVSCRDGRWKFMYRNVDNVDNVGNLYESKDNSNRVYGAGSRLEKSHVDTKELRNVLGFSPVRSILTASF
jgi:hypothetical protein